MADTAYEDRILFPLPRCPECGSDMAPRFNPLLTVNKIMDFKCVKCGYSSA